MRSFLRLLGRLLGVATALALLAAVGLFALGWLSMPDRSPGILRIPGLSEPVDVAIDADGIPRIRAASMADAAAALGYLHARERMFEMELMRRTASGRLSELAGAATLPLDRSMRVLGLRERAVADLATLPASTVALLAAYADGVNAWISTRGRFAAPEFIAFGAPEPWAPVDSLLWGKLMGVWLSGNEGAELARLGAAGHLTPAQMGQLWPPQTAVLPPSANADPDRRFAAVAAGLAAVLPHFPQPFTQPATASNEWALDGRHTASGAPLLAGDPHLGFGFPSLWYLARIDTPQGTLAGATAPGVPFLVLGHNGHVAWTFTTTGADTQDVFEETALPDGGYQTPDGPQPFTLREERIGVRGQPDVVMTVRETRHGPVVSDLDKPNDKPGGPVLAAAMANLLPGDTSAAGLEALNQATDVAAAGRAAAMISAPVQNLLVADRATIAQFTTGRVPLRRAGDGFMPVAGADGAHDWVGWASGDQLPHVVSPASGRIVNGNEPTWSPDFPVFMGRDAFADWRARRMRTLLEGSDRHTPADFAAMQADSTSEFARQILPALRDLPIPDGPAAKAAALLRGWNGEMAADLPQPLVFNAWIQRFYLLLLQRNQAPEAITPWSEFTAYVLTPAGAHWCGGDCAGLLVQALQDAVAALSPRLGADPAGWRWGSVHQAIFADPLLSRLPLIGPLAVARVEVPGDDTTLFRGGDRPGRYDARHGAEYRGVYDLADLDRSLFMVAPGESGNLFSRHAHDMLARWRTGGTVTLGPQPATVSATLRLLP
jgi:penicillin amidase